jgi:Ca2+-binding RTX toxin-like protein
MKIQFDYRFDRNGFFNDPQRKAALEKAGEIWSSLLKDDFEAIPAGVEFTVQNPETGANQTVILDEAVDDLIIFVGASNNPLGSGSGLQAQKSATGCACWRCQAAAAGEVELSQKGILARQNTRNNANSGLLALAGPQGTDARGDAFQSRVAENFRGQQVTDFEPWAGVAAFNLSAAWDFSLDNPTGQFDFVSTALHEIGHILGFGVSDTFLNLVRGSVFQGENAKQINGGNGIPLQSDLAHVREGFSNNTVLMDPVYNGGRSLPSNVDLAMLADIGYEIDGYRAQGTTIPLATDANETIFGTIVADFLDGLAGDDRLQGNEGNDILAGGAGNDFLFGEDGDDRLFGNDGNDELQGGEGNDTLNGGTGNDRYFGSGGSDSFVIEIDSSRVEIIDFQQGEDRVVVSTEFGFTNPSQILGTIANSGDSTTGGFFSQLNLNANTIVTIVHNAPLRDSDFAIESMADISIAADANSLTIQFPKVLNLSSLNLYGKGNNPDLRLLGENSGEIRGSAVWNEVDRILTFIPTGMPLEDDRYNLSLLGSNDGFVYDNGEPIDGNNDNIPGGNLDYSFTIANGNPPSINIKDVIAAPSATIEIPISLDFANGIQTIDFTIDYNGDLLGVTGVNVDPNLWTVNQQQIDPVSGSIAVSLEAKTSLVGSNNLLSLQAVVDASASYSATDIIEVRDVSANGGSVRVLGDRSLQQVVLAGDVTGNGGYNSLDAALISGVASGIDSGFAPFPLTDPNLIGDPNLDGTVSVADSLAIARSTVGL